MIIGWSGTLATVSLGQWNEKYSHCMRSGNDSVHGNKTNSNTKKERLNDGRI